MTEPESKRIKISVGAFDDVNKHVKQKTLIDFSTTDDDDDGDYKESSAEETSALSSVESSSISYMSSSSISDDESDDYTVSVRKRSNVSVHEDSIQSERNGRPSYRQPTRSSSAESLPSDNVVQTTITRVQNTLPQVAYQIPEANGRDFIRKPGVESPEHKPIKSGIVYDARMLKHAPVDPIDFDHPESPDRLIAIFDALVQDGCLDMFERIDVAPARQDQICLFHTHRHYQDIVRLHSASLSELLNANKTFSSLYVNNDSVEAAALSCGAVLQLADAVWDGKVRNGFALVRPPGHHAEADEAMGFCIYNNIAIAALHLKANKGAKRILVLDWDIHHGNGTQQAFYDDPDILFVSIHRFDGGKFYPGTPLADYIYSGGSKAPGKNINIPWDCGKMNDADYLYTFNTLIIPILQEFQPEIILVSCGFDAVRNDPIGGCDLTPGGFAHMTYLLSQFANGKVILVLEGGYHLGSISACAVHVAHALLGMPLVSYDRQATISYECVSVVDRVRRLMSQYWRFLGRFEIPTDIATAPLPQPPNPYVGTVVQPVWGLVKAENPQRPFAISLGSLLKSYRERVFESMDMRPLLFRCEQESVDLIVFDAFISRVLKGNLILFVHDRPVVRYEGDCVENVADSDKSFAIDPFFNLIRHFSKDNWSVIDISINCHFAPDSIDRHGHLRHRNDQRRIHSLINDVVRIIDPVFETFFSKPSRNTRAIFLSGIAASYMPNFANKKHIQNCIDSVVAVYPNNRTSEYMAPILRGAVSPAQKEWYELNTVNLMHGFGDLWEVNYLNDSGVLLSLGDPADLPDCWDVPEVITAHESEILRILKGEWWW